MSTPSNSGGLFLRGHEEKSRFPDLRGGGRFEKENTQMKHGIAASSSVLGTLLIAFVFVAPGISARPATADSPEVTQLLADVKTEAVELRADTEDMKAFTGSTNLDGRVTPRRSSRLRRASTQLVSCLPNCMTRRPPALRGSNRQLTASLHCCKSSPRILTESDRTLEREASPDPHCALHGLCSCKL